MLRDLFTAFGGMLGIVCGVVLAIMTLSACIAAGPIGWIAAYWLVPLAFCAGVAGGLLAFGLLLLLLAGSALAVVIGLLHAIV